MRRYAALMCGVLALFMLKGCTSTSAQQQEPPRRPDVSQPPPPPAESMSAQTGLCEATKTIRIVEQEGIAIQINRCERVSGNNVQCNFTMASCFRDRMVDFSLGWLKSKSRMFDDAGNEYIANRIQVGRGEKPRSSSVFVRANLVADVPVEVLVDFNNISTQATKISRIDLFLRGTTDRRPEKCCSVFPYRDIDLLR
jgi:hypothetical protein